MKELEYIKYLAHMLDEAMKSKLDEYSEDAAGVTKQQLLERKKLNEGEDFIIPYGNIMSKNLFTKEDAFAGRGATTVPSMRPDALYENKAAFVKKFGSEPGFKSVFSKFWNIVRKRTNGVEKDIEHWQNRPWKEFADFVAGYDMKNKSDRKDAGYIADARCHGAVRLGRKDGYEVWYVPTWEAAQDIGCFYRGRSAQWCILNRDRKAWQEYTEQQDESFVFIVRTAYDRKDTFNKVALEIDQNGELLFIWGDDDDGHEMEPSQNRFDYEAAQEEYFGSYDQDDPMAEIFADMDAERRAAEGGLDPDIAEYDAIPADFRHIVDFAMDKFDKFARSHRLSK